VVREGVNNRAVLVPQQAVSRNPKGDPLSLIVDGTGTVQQRMLTLDRAVGNMWLVSSGLTFGDRVIVEGIQRVRPGVSVKVIPFEADKGNHGEKGEQSTLSPVKAN
jgi:membrane fusion protein (multidrug efflux system)